MYAKLTHNACVAYPEWIKDKKAKLPNIIDDEIKNAAAAAAAISQDELIETEDT